MLGCQPNGQHTGASKSDGRPHVHERPANRNNNATTTPTTKPPIANHAPTSIECARRSTGSTGSREPAAKIDSSV